MGCGCGKPKSRAANAPAEPTAKMRNIKNNGKRS